MVRAVLQGSYLAQLRAELGQGQTARVRGTDHGFNPILLVPDVLVRRQVKPDYLAEVLCHKHLHVVIRLLQISLGLDHHPGPQLIDFIDAVVTVQTTVFGNSLHGGPQHLLRNLQGFCPPLSAAWTLGPCQNSHLNHLLGWHGTPVPPQ